MQRHAYICLAGAFAMVCESQPGSRLEVELRTDTDPDLNDSDMFLDLIREVVKTEQRG